MKMTMVNSGLKGLIQVSYLNLGLLIFIQLNIKHLQILMFNIHPIPNKV